MEIANACPCRKKIFTKSYKEYTLCVDYTVILFFLHCAVHRKQQACKFALKSTTPLLRKESYFCVLNQLQLCLPNGSYCLCSESA